MRQQWVFTAFSALLLVGAAPTAGADGGIVTKVNGRVMILRGNDKLPATVGATITAGDSVVTAEGAGAQFRFDDNSVFAVAGDSEFRVDDFHRAHRDTSGAALFSLIRGGFRTITGLIGKARGDTYQARTAVATMGVRGSAYAAVLCKDKCAAKGNFKPGLYVKAEKGVITVKNGQGQLALRAGQIAFVVSADGAPVIVQVSPFDDPQFSAAYEIDLDIQFEVQPPKIEPEPPASKS